MDSVRFGLDHPAGGQPSNSLPGGECKPGATPEKDARPVHSLSPRGLMHLSPVRCPLPCSLPDTNGTLFLLLGALLPGYLKALDPVRLNVE